MKPILDQLKAVLMNVSLAALNVALRGQNMPAVDVATLRALTAHRPAYVGARITGL